MRGPYNLYLWLRQGQLYIDLHEPDRFNNKKACEYLEYLFQKWFSILKDRKPSQKITMSEALVMIDERLATDCQSIFKNHSSFCFIKRVRFNSITGERRKIGVWFKFLV